jgi:hypothetical protein
MIDIVKAESVMALPFLFVSSYINELLVAVTVNNKLTCALAKS